MYVKNGWYVSGWTSEVSENGLFCRTIAGKPLLFYRLEGGRLNCLEDRCCHRASPLSMGRREGDDIRCMYHGLKFAASGQCNAIPGQDKIPPSFCVRNFPVVEKYNWIWVWMGDAALADEALIPDCSSLTAPGWASKQGGYIHYKAPHDLICDNLLDVSHLGWLHPTTLGGTERPGELKVERIPRGVRLERWQLNDVPAPFHTLHKKFEGNVDRWYFIDFQFPGVLTMHSGVQASGTGATDRNFADGLEYRSCQAVTPETEDSTHYFFALPHNFSIDDPSVTEAIHQNLLIAFEEDRVMIEAQVRSLALQPDRKMMAIGADVALIQYRRAVEEQLKKELTE